MRTGTLSRSLEGTGSVGLEVGSLVFIAFALSDSTELFFTLKHVRRTFT